MDYRPVIESRYIREAWQQLLHDIFRSKVSFWREPSVVHASSRLAKQALNLGKISLADGESIAIYEVELTDNVDIERNRRGIRDMLTTDWRNMGYAGAFMFCYRKNESVLRFSYVSESWSFATDGTYKKDSTDTRRFTYLLGEGHRSRTAIQQFEGLKKSGLSLRDLTKAFSVDAVSDMFFDDYKQQYEDIIAFITGKRMVKVANKWEEREVGEPNETIFSEFRVFADPEKAIRDYVKKLMGRLVFLQFLQKKGWLGVPVNAHWGDGDREFIQHLFENTADKDNFVDNVLEPLFYDINSERDGDIASPAVGKDIRVPYLNGGLFEPDAADAVDFPLPAKFMKSMLDFFASYNFTIDENDPDDAEMGVDPEMLGRIFENLLEDNKDKGAFYTPKEIVGYMCRESLIAYLQTDITDEAQREAIRQFVTNHKSVENLPDNVLQNLIDVKICDPAIGSGAFPMGLLKELYLCRAALEGFDQKKATEIKKHIIQQNIYGVDIERGAVDTARLRFWLALIVDEESPEALPNLDFKIMQGNSLLESFHGIDLSNLLGTQAVEQVRIIFDDESCAQELLLKSLRDFYSCSNANQKKTLRAKIDAQLRDLLRTRITKPELQKEIDSLGAQNDKFFLWHTWFSDVFSKGGFDIVIGNPPYVDAKRLKHISQELRSFDIYVGTADLYTYFYELSLKCLTRNGILTFITSNKWMRSEYGRNLRKMFLSNTIEQLIDFGRNRLFGATVDSNIILVRKAQFKKAPKLFYFNEKVQGFTLQEMLLTGQVPCVELNENSWLLNAGKNETLLSKLEKYGIPLNKFDISIFRGIPTGYNEAFIINSQTRDTIIRNCRNEKEREMTTEIIKPMLRGSDIQSFGYNWADKWIISTFPSRNYDIDQYPALKQYLLSFGLKKLEQTGHTYHENGIIIKARKKTRNKWFELQDSIKYWRDFDKPKIVWQAISKRIAFGYDSSGEFYSDVTTFIMTGNEHLLYILAILNSKLFEYALLNIYLEGDTFKSKNAIIQNFPIPRVNVEGEKQLTDIVNQIISLKQKDSFANIDKLQREIDIRVYRLYGLTYNEVLIVDPETIITREGYEKS